MADSSNNRIQKFVFVSGHSGHVPDGGNRPGPALVLDKAGDDDYAVYEGNISDFGSHIALTCGTDGGTSTTITPAPGNNYYLVVPRAPTHEGSYGTDSDGNERPQAIGPCG